MSFKHHTIKLTKPTLESSWGLKIVSKGEEAAQIIEIDQIDPNGPAGRGGSLKSGDVILSINGVTIVDQKAAINLMTGALEVTMVISRPKRASVLRRLSSAKLRAGGKPESSVPLAPQESALSARAEPSDRGPPADAAECDGPKHDPDKPWQYTVVVTKREGPSPIGIKLKKTQPGELPYVVGIDAAGPAAGTALEIGDQLVAIGPADDTTPAADASIPSDVAKTVRENSLLRLTLLRFGVSAAATAVQARMRGRLARTQASAKDAGAGAPASPATGEEEVIVVHAKAIDASAPDGSPSRSAQATPNVAAPTEAPKSFAFFGGEKRDQPRPDSSAGAPQVNGLTANIACLFCGLCRGAQGPHGRRVLMDKK